MKKFFSISALCAVLVWTGCTDKTLTVTFDSQGGTPVESIKKVESGSKITEPKPPTKPNFDFDGWYKEPTCVTDWKFESDVVTKNITLYAKWVPTIGEIAELESVYYYGDYYGSGAENFDLKFSAGGNSYYFELFSTTAESAGEYKVVPAEGTYEFDATSSHGLLTMSNNSSVYTESGGYDFVSGNVKIKKVGSNYKVVADLVDENGVAHRFTYTGNLFFYLYHDEPTTKVNVTINATIVQYNRNYKNYYGVGENLYFEVADAAEENGANVDFICSGSGLTSLPVGTYPINTTMGINTVVARSMELVREYSGGYGSGIYYNDYPYYLVSGNVVVNAGGFTLTGTSFHGSTFTVNYTGSLAVTSASSAPAQAQAPPRSNFDKKRGKDFRQLIIDN